MYSLHKLLAKGDEFKIHCATKSESDRILAALHKQGIRWYMGASLLERSNWENYKENTYYIVERNKLLYGELDCEMENVIPSTSVSTTPIKFRKVKDERETKKTTI